MPDPTPHEPTEKSREFVFNMSRAGITQVQIADIIGITDKTLRKHYRSELDNATALTVTQVAGCLLEKALGGDTPSQIFYLKTKGGWSEKIKLGGDDSDPIIHKIIREVVDVNSDDKNA